MPLDGHSYLVSQGWSGKGTGLRQGAISRPLAIPQKKTLAGLGKDRDEAFPFWDHLFTAAAKSIQVKISSDSDDSDDAGPSSAIALKRTSTGILSNRRPLDGTPATSGTSTPDSELTAKPRLNLLAVAKREAAKRGLYAKFFRGPVLGPDTGLDEDGGAGTASSSTPVAVAVTEKDAGGSEKKRKRKSDDSTEDLEWKSERKRQKKKLKEVAKLAKKEKRKDSERTEGSGLSQEKQTDSKERKKEMGIESDRKKAKGERKRDGKEGKKSKRQREASPEKVRCDASHDDCSDGTHDHLEGKAADAVVVETNKKNKGKRK